MIVKDKLGNRIEIGELVLAACQEGTQQINVYGRPIKITQGGIALPRLGSHKGPPDFTPPVMTVQFFLDIPIDPATGMIQSVTKVVDPDPSQAEAIRKNFSEEADSLIKLD